MANGAAAAANTTTKVRKRKESQFSLVMKRLSKNRLAMAGLVIILILFLLAIFSPWIMPYPYEEMNMAERFASPSLKHLCGTDEMGRDIFSRLLYGARASLSLGFLATIISTVIGMIIGSIVGYFGGAVDTVVWISCRQFPESCWRSQSRHVWEVVLQIQLLRFPSAVSR